MGILAYQEWCNYHGNLIPAVDRLPPIGTFWCSVKVLQLKHLSLKQAYESNNNKEREQVGLATQYKSNWIMWEKERGKRMSTLKQSLSDRRMYLAAYKAITKLQWQSRWENQT